MLHAASVDQWISFVTIADLHSSSQKTQNELNACSPANLGPQKTHTRLTHTSVDRQQVQMLRLPLQNRQIASESPRQCRRRPRRSAQCARPRAAMVASDIPPCTRRRAPWSGTAANSRARSEATARATCFSHLLCPGAHKHVLAAADVHRGARCAKILVGPRTRRQAEQAACLRHRPARQNGNVCRYAETLLAET